MARQSRVGTPSRGFIMLMIAVLVIIVILLLIASSYRQAKPIRQMERKGVALLLPASLGPILGHPGEPIADITYSRSLQA